MEKTYTVDESVGGVNVCVNLIHPMRNILYETVNVYVIDDPSSIYIPPDAPLASEYYYQSIHTKCSLEWIKHIMCIECDNLIHPTAKA